LSTPFEAFDGKIETKEKGFKEKKTNISYNPRELLIACKEGDIGGCKGH